MKKMRKFFVLLLVLVMAFCTSTTVFAATNTQDGIEVTLTTDKTVYSSNEQIVVKLTVKNTNEVDITNVSLENLIPEGYKLAEGSETTKQIELLGAGQQIDITVTYVANSEDNKKPDSGDNNDDDKKPDGGDSNDDNNKKPDSGNNDNSNSQSNIDDKVDSTPPTSDDSNIMLWIVLMFLAGCGIIVVLKLDKKKRNIVLSLFLCIAMVGTMFVSIFSVQANAAENSNSSHSVDVSTTVSVDGKEITIKAKVSYAYEPADDTPVNYTRGEWIDMLTEKVGMNLSEDTSNVDYYYADTEDSSYGIAIEAAQAYGILPPPEVEDLEQDIPYFDPDGIATREFAAYTAVHAMGFDGTHSYDTSNWGDWDLIQYQNEAAIAVGNGFLNLDANMLFNPTVSLSSIDVKTIFDAIDEIKLADETIDEMAYDNSQYVEDVIKDELDSITDYTVIENGDGTYTVYLPKSDYTSEIIEDSVIVLPENDTYITGISLKVKTVTENDTQLILNCVEPELAEVFTKIDFAGGGTASVGEVVPVEGVDVEYNPYGSVDGEYAIALARNINVGGSTSVPGTFTFDLGEGKKISDNLKISGSVEVEIPKITCIADIDVGWFDVDVNEFTVSVTEKVEMKGKLEYTLSESGYELSNGNFESGRIELGRVPIAIGTTGLSFDFVFFCNFEAKGSASITYTIESTQGYQYKNGAGRSLFEYDDSLDFLELKGSAKAGLGVAGDLCAFTIFDLVGYSGEAGVAFNASITPHVLATDTLYCGDVTMYAYAKHGLDQETLVGEFLKNVCHYTLEFEPLKNNSSNPFKLKFHVENGHRVAECSFGMGGITGNVYSLDDRTPLRNARVNIYSDNSGGSDLIRTLYTDEDGKYSIDNLTEGTYRITVSATGYFTYESTVEVVHNQMTYIENLLMVDRDASGSSGVVEGTIVNAVNGEGVENTSYVLREGWNNRTGESIESGVFEEASYSMTLPVGNYTLEISKEGYVTNYTNIAVSENVSTGTNIVISPVNVDATGEELRIVLTWGEYPYDLDSHLVCVSEDSYHIYYSDMVHYNYDYDYDYDYNYNESIIANLDIDDTSSYGPETTTVYQIRPDDKFSFYVHDFTNLSSNDSIEMSNSDAKVQVYLDGRNVATYFIPTNHGGTLWHVFDYDAATGITPVNTFSYHDDPYTVGGINTFNLRMIANDLISKDVLTDFFDTKNAA